MCSKWGLKTQNDVEEGNYTGEGLYTWLLTLDSLSKSVGSSAAGGNVVAESQKETHSRHRQV